MKNIFFLAALLLLYSCDKRDDFYGGVNITPVIEVKKSNSNTSFTSVFNDSVKTMYPTYDMDIQLKDEENLSLTATSNVPADKIALYGTSKISLALDTAKATLGVHAITLLTKDSYEKEGKAIANLTLFTNLKPVADVYVDKVGVNDPYEYTLNASGSYDRDKKYGGKIIEYQYTIGTYEVKSPLDKINYIFPSPGNYWVHVTVKDNNDEWSITKTIYVAIN